MTWRGERALPPLAQGKTHLIIPSCPAVSFPGLTVRPPTSHQTVEAVKGLQPTDTVLPREGDGERGGLGLYGRHHSIFQPFPGEHTIAVVPTLLPSSAQFVILGVKEGLVPLSKRKVTL